MNKYQKSLDYIVKNSCPMKTCCSECKINKSCNSLAKDRINILQELVDKETPKKPNLEGDGYDDKGNLIYDTWICPNCEKHYELDYDEYDYCPNCGQKILWGDEDE